MGVSFIHAALMMRGFEESGAGSGHFSLGFVRGGGGPSKSLRPRKTLTGRPPPKNAHGSPCPREFPPGPGTLRSDRNFQIQNEGKKNRPLHSKKLNEGMNWEEGKKGEGKRGEREGRGEMNSVRVSLGGKGGAEGR